MATSAYTLIILTSESGGLDPMLEHRVVQASAPEEALTYALTDLRNGGTEGVLNAVVLEGDHKDVGTVSEFGIEQQYQGLLAGEDGV